MNLLKESDAQSARERTGSRLRDDEGTSARIAGLQRQGGGGGPRHAQARQIPAWRVFVVPSGKIRGPGNPGGRAPAFGSAGCGFAAEHLEQTRLGRGRQGCRGHRRICSTSTPTRPRAGRRRRPSTGALERVDAAHKELSDLPAEDLAGHYRQGLGKTRKDARSNAAASSTTGPKRISTKPARRSRHCWERSDSCRTE